MKLDAFIGLAAIPLTIILTFALFFLAIPLATQKGRRDTLQAINELDFRSHAIGSVASLWSLMFQRLFGGRFFSWRRLLAVVAYTTLVSLLCFGVWLVSIFVLRNPKHLLLASPPLDFQQGFAQYYLGGGYVVSLVIDFMAIQLTMWCIRLGLKLGFFSLRFTLAFVASLLTSCLLFTLAVYVFHRWNVEDLYGVVAPYDDVPAVAYVPLEYIKSGLHFFEPRIFMYMTSRGMYGSYFLPEPVLLYSALVSHLSLVAITLAYTLASGLERVKLLSIWFVRSVGKPGVSARGVVVVIFIGLLTLILVIVIASMVLSLMI